METDILIQSSLLAGVPGVRHAFTSRVGGVSTGAYHDLNLSYRVGDAREAVEENQRRLLSALSANDHTLVWLKQVHGDVVHEVTHLAGRSVEGDGLWTRDRAAAVSVLVADCVPVLIADKQGRAVAAVHAGWRGTRLRVAARMVERLVAAGFSANELVVAIGPAIGPCCFEIGDDVALELRQAYADAVSLVRPHEGGKWAADLWALNRESLLAAGVLKENIEELRQCTVCTHDRFFSHRRDQGTTGRQAGVILLAR